MESNEHLMRHELREAERGEAMGWTEYRFPAWAPIAMGLWAGSFTLGVAYLDGVPGNLSSLVHLALALGYIWWDRRTQDAFPSSGGSVPREYHRPTTVMALGGGVVVLLAWASGWFVAGWAGALVAALGWGAVTARYNRQYAAASARVRERLA